MFERIEVLYDNGKLDAVGVEKAVARGWITQEQAEQILNPQPEVL